ncbi:metal-dependent hydrolase [Mammaliicoccus sciuri]|uniref:metal-dependent hydrolase n=1 Tax=Mammaliicoccus sciuri TaxID=1296 RepID=UPI000E6873E5|nr:metal-dependent hydrolase [Mammaliicoccus sciuri]RIO12275.1 metal-dependent hydrolase [Mammaliicoccus sciuri]RIO19796.1 metal-dependent hydrolase [Mammaliicoccus sciuri]
MDTGTHVVMGVVLTGLATLDPHVTPTFAAVATGIMVGSQIPDIDTVLKLKNNAIYVKNHRGITHSIPFTLLWPLILTFLIFVIFPGVDVLHIWLWTQFAVFFHVFVDIFNSYGTQALRPISNKWIQLSIINTFDPIIFVAHLVAILLWTLGVNAGIAFGTLYFLLIFYYIVRFILQKAIKDQALKQIQQEDNPVKIFVAPTIRFMEWRIAIQTETHDYVGRSYGRNVAFNDVFKRQAFPNDHIMAYAKYDENLRSFLSFSSIYRWEVTRIDKKTTELRFIDLRYLKNGHYPFVAILHLDDDMKVTNSYIGWVFTEEKLMKKLEA